MNSIFIRVDASVRSGSGHVMRCLTLANELTAKGCEVRFISRVLPGNLCDYIEELDFSVSRLSDSLSDKQDAEATVKIVRSYALNGGFVIVDSYRLSLPWQKHIKAAGNQLMVLDDLADRKHYCDILLNQNYRSGLHDRYPDLVPLSATLLLGAHYALIRKEFSEFREASIERRKSPKKKNILVFMGGSDPDNDTGKVLIGFLRSKIIESIKINVVIGVGNPNKKELEVLCGGHKNIVLHIQTAHMVKLMVEADFAIMAGGTTTWERCVLGLPSLVVVQSEDQLPSTIALDRMGAHKCLGYASDISSDKYLESFSKVTHSDLLAMSEVSKDICDGNGAARVSEQIIDILK